MDFYRPVPPAMRNAISRPLLELGNTASTIGSEMWNTPPASGSPSSTILSGRPLSTTAFTDVSIALAAGTDHYQGLARLIRLEQELGPSIATLTRSSIETLGRGWWLLDSVDAAQMEHRAAATAVKEHETAARNGVGSMLVFGDARREPVADPLSQAMARLAAVQVEGVTETVPGYKALAVAIMDAAGIEGPAAAYSHLSGVAHGEASTIGGLGTPSANRPVDDDTTFSLGLPIANARNYAFTVTNVLDAFMSKIIAMWQVRAFKERWEQARWRTFQKFDELFTALADAPDPATRPK